MLRSTRPGLTPECDGRGDVASLVDRAADRLDARIAGYGTTGIARRALLGVGGDPLHFFRRRLPPVGAHHWVSTFDERGQATGRLARTRVERGSDPANPAKPARYV